MTKSGLANENLPRVHEANASNIHSFLNSKAYASPSLSIKKISHAISHHCIHRFLKVLVSCIVNETMYTYSYGNPGTEVSLKEVYLVSGRSKGLYPSNSGFRANYHVIQVFK